MQTTGLKGDQLSPQQSRLWHWLQEKSGYRVQCALEVTGDLKADVLQQALQYTVDRYEILRTTFIHVADMDLPMQAISSHIEISCPLIDIEQLSTGTQQAYLEKQWCELMQRPFDVEKGPLLRAEALRLAPQSHVLLLSIHALCADALTLRQLGAAILQAYAACWRKRAEIEEEDPLQYVNVIAWLNELPQEEEEQISRWHKLPLSQLRGMPLPFERSEESLQRERTGFVQGAFEPRHVTIPLSEQLQHRLRVLSQRFEVSSEVILLTSWQILLWRLTDNPDLLIGIFCDGRPYEELTHLVGPYARMLPISISLTKSRSFSWALRQMQQTYQQSLEGQLSFPWEALRVDEREQLYFPVSFAYESWSIPATSGPLTFSLQRQECWLEPFHLQLHAWEVSESLQLQLLYNVAVFLPQRAQQLAELFIQVLEAATNQPEMPLSALPLLSEGEQEARRERWRGPERNWPFQPLHRLFEAQAGLHPTAPAVRSGSLVLSYQQVEQQANRLAHLLRQQGLRPTGRVVLCLPRTHWAIIGLLAVHKAGGCYVPLDPEQPSARLARLVQDVTPSVIVCPQGLCSQLPAGSAAVLPLETLSDLLVQQPATPPPVEVAPGDGAYVIYTSGSTGVPKGVLIGQQSVSNYTQALCERLDLSTGWHFATVSSLAADLGNTAIFAGLASGGCVHVLDSSLLSDAAALSAYVEQYPLDVLKIVPSHLQALLQAGADGVLPRERLVLGGEVFPWSLVQQVQQRHPPCRLYNHYGPTETTVGVLVRDLGSVAQIMLPPSEQRGGGVPLGRPLANIQIYILDEQQQWVPAGVVGELYIGGAGLASGYLGQEEETRRRFVQIECGGRSERVYRTGDRVREGLAGEIEFVGRADEQVKLRGYRIELGEVEAQLRRVEGIREAVVQKRERAGGEAGLVGYLVAWKQPGPGKQQVWEALREQVPEYLVPQELWWLEALPLTANGKVDRQRLAESVLEEPEAVESWEQARTPIEEVVMELWREVLTLPEVSRSANFFRLGGHSLLATRLTARLRSVFGIEVPINWLFEAPTVARLSERVQKALGGQQSEALTPIERVSREQVLPLSFGQQRLWFLDQLEPGRATYNVTLALWVRGQLMVEAVDRSLREIERRHEVLRTTFAQGDEGPMQVIHLPADREGGMRWIDLQGLGESRERQEAQRLANQEAGQPFDLQGGPVWRVYLGRLSRQEHALLWTMHHCVSDARSSEVLAREFLQLYRAYSQGQASPLAELPVQYADYACWQRQWLRGEVLQEQLDYWKHQLADLAPLELPTDRPRPPVQSFRGDSRSFTIPAQVSTALLDLSKQQGVTLFMTLVAAFQVLLFRLSGQEDIVVGTPIANRGREEIDGLIGFFTNTLVLRTSLAGNPSFLELLERVRKVALGAYGHQDIPFEQLVEALDPQRDLQRSPLFQILFIVQHARRQPAESLAGIELEALPEEHTTAKFDITLAMMQTEQGLHGAIEYCTDLFEPATIERFLSHWLVLLQALVQQPHRPVTTLSLWQPVALQTMLTAWTGPRTPLRPSICLHHLFEEQVARTPDACAAVCGEQQISYQQLNEQARRLAGYLRNLGVGPEHLVGLYLPRSIELLIGVLGILKAGGAYVPLDPVYPRLWLERILAQAGLSVLLTRESLREHLAGSSAALVCIEQTRQEAMEVVETPSELLSPEHLAYVIYTSGSTGEPKGVAMPHRGLVNLMQWQNSRSTMGVQSRTLQFTSLSFDVSCQELFATWSTGGNLVLLEQHQRQDAQLLLRYLWEQGIERLFLPFVALYQLGQVAQEHNESLPESLREVATAGEQVQVSDPLMEFFKRLPECRLDNQYGPSETHVVTAHWLDKDPENWPALPPIGTAISNDEVYVFDGDLQPVPVGVIGELYLGGVCLARGYWQRADLTAERFVPHPCSRNAGARLYRTGDRVRSRADGTLEFLGRQDEMVKVRGYRIELGEIEAVIRDHPAVEAVALGVQKVGIGDTRLVAYVVFKGEQRLTLRDLRRYVGARLPEYMQPAELVEMESLPLTASGKLDRKRLPVLKSGEEEQTSGFEQGEARDELEALVLQSWKQVLRREQIGRQENFFEIGGHSLLAAQVIARLRGLIGLEVPVRALFEAPTVAALTIYVRQELRRGQGMQVPAIVPVSRNQQLPLSFAQQRLWFLDQLEPQNIAYIIPQVVRLRGHVDRSALREALAEVLRRHESLRTTFPSQQGEPIQQIAAEPQTRLFVLDLQGLSAQQREQQARQLAQQEAQRPFDLALGPLVRSYLVWLEEQEYVLLLTMHHIVSDGWSMSILTRELSSLYQAFAAGQPSPLAPLPVQYADYALWQREWLQGEVLQRQLDYWKHSLADLQSLELPLDHPRPVTQTFQGKWQHLQLSNLLSKRLRALSQREGVTLYMTLLASWQALLSRYSGQEDVTVGTPIANRTHEELEGLIGFFVNTLVLRTDLSGDPSFVEILRRVREVALGAYAHQDLSFEQVVEAIHPERNLNRNPLFQVTFRLLENNASQDPLEETGGLSGPTSYPVEEESTSIKFDLMMVMIDTNQGLRGVLGYNTDLFEVSTIERLLEHFQHLLEGIVARPEQQLSALPLLSETQRWQILQEWNATWIDFARPLYLHRLFEDQVQRTPDAIALAFEDEQLTYRRVNTYANQLAHYLRTLGVSAEKVVGLCLDRSPGMLIGILAILKAGGAYVPLDPTYPPQRLAFLLADAQVSILLTSQALLMQLPEHDAQIVCLENVRSAFSPVGEENPVSEVLPEHLAYVMYTSGSTGAPKGVQVTHQAIANRLLWAQQAQPLYAWDRVIQVASFSFDIALWELFGPLIAGARVVLLLPGGQQETSYLLQVLKQQQVTIAHFVPSLLQVLVEESRFATENTLRRVLCGGERLSVELAERFLERMTIELHQFYGPTEAAISMTSWECTREVGQRKIPIGRPIANMQGYVLAPETMEPVPVGVTGELYIGGLGLARGYRGQAALTAERFVPHPFSQQAGARLYRTGDRVRFRPDGSLEYLGRTDQQVKVRGYRIELGEIEAVLNKHPQVKQSVVLLPEEDNQDKGLVAYVVSEEGERAPLDRGGELRAFLKSRLPDYMVPAQFVFLKTLPLTSHGKVDRRSLLALGWPEEEQREQEVARSSFNPVEELVQQVYQEVLGRREVGLHEDFFEAGGHSLLAMRVIARLRGLIGLDVPVHVLFEETTAADLAVYLQQELRQEQGVQIPAIVPVSRNQQLPLSFAQQRLWFLDQLEPQNIAYNIAQAARLRGHVDRSALREALAEVLRRHESLRTTFPSQQGEPIQQIAVEPQTRLFVLDLRGLSAQQREQQAHQLAQQEAQRPFDLALGPLVRSYLVWLEEQEYVLLLTMHHIVSDGWSMSILTRELSSLYQAFAADQPSPLAPLAIQYADYALWQREWLRGEVLQRQLDYWKHSLADLQSLELPLDHPRPVTQTFRGAKQRLQLSNQLRQHLRALSQREGVTLFMTMVAAFQVLLSRYSGQEDIAVGTPVANRTHEELEGLIGFFVNTLVLRTDLSGDPSFLDLLVRVRAGTLSAYNHQDAPFEQVVEVVQSLRDRSRSPLFQAFFVLQNTPDAPDVSVAVQSEGLASEQPTAKFELSMIVGEHEQGMGITLEYNTDLFEARTIERLLERFQHLLEGIVARPEQRLSALPLLSPEEREQLLEHWNATRIEGAEDRCLHQLFEAQAQATPERTAVVWEGQHLSYAYLNRRANQLAASLRREGVGPEVLVGVYLPRGAELPLALLAILKAGGAYVPLDPNYPSHRVSIIAQDARLRVVLTQSTLREQWVVSVEATLLCLDTLWPCLAEESLVDEVSAVRPNHCAYVLYTSGSTGMPKGVVITHRSAVALVRWAHQDFGEDELAGVLASTSICFDLSIFEFFVPLCRGGSIFLVENLLHLSDLSDAGRVTLINTVPSVLTEALALGALPASVRTVNLAGEPLPVTLVRQLYQQESLQAVYNLYGPTEDTTYSTGVLQPRAVQAVSIGRPIAGSQAYVLDAHLEPVAIGIVGELYLGGEGLARGYLRRADLTAERFIPHPFGRQPGARLYRTGDLVRYLEDGQLEYLGRADQQVKVRGYRIELGEIEAVIRDHPAVEAVALGVQRVGIGDTRLVAYVVFRREQRLTLRDLRRYVGARLPEYMQPAELLEMESLPLTASGKLDRKRLPVLKSSEEEQTSGFEEREARDELEALVLQSWKQVLRREQIGRQENFFEIGGHSLLAAQVIARLRGLIGLEVPVRALFEAPTVAALTIYVRQELRRGQGMQVPAVVPVSRSQQLPLSFAQQRLWFLDQLEPQNIAYNIAQAARLRGHVDRSALREALTEVLRRHESLRTTFPSHQGEPIQQIAAEPQTRLFVLDLRGLSAQQREQQARQLAQQEAQRPFDLASGSLVRSYLVWLEEQEYVLLLTMHHIISDGWSMSILTRELSSLYQAFAAGQPSPLAPLPVQYADYALWQREWLQGEVLKEHIRYWTRQLSEARAVEVPGDYPRPAVFSHRGASYGFQVEGGLAEGLEKLSRQEGVTLFMTLLAGWQVLLARLSGQQDIVVGTDSANRSHLETEGLIGFFVNLLILRNKINSNLSFREALHDVREMVLGAYAHQELPFEMIVEHLRLERTNNRTPLVNVLFVMQNIPVTNVNLTDLLTSSVERSSISAKFDLALFVTEDPQGLYGAVNYSLDLFKHETVVVLMQRYMALLRSVVTEPDTQIANLETTTEEEKAREQVSLRRNLKLRRGERLQISKGDTDQPVEG